MSKVEYPFRFGRSGLPLKPRVGEVVYVPSGEDRLPTLGSLDACLLKGGRATVVEGPRKSSIYVAEHPGIAYSWWILQKRQKSLFHEYGDRQARPPTSEEVEAAKAEKRVRAETEKAARLAAEKAKTEPQKFRVMNRGLLEVPIWNDRTRARNWAAIVRLDPFAPGGLSRYWLPKGNGPSYYIIPEQVAQYDVLEFAADGFSFGGTKRPSRYYGVVKEFDPSRYIVLEPRPKAAEALLLARKYLDTKTRSENSEASSGVL